MLANVILVLSPMLDCLQPLVMSAAFWHVSPFAPGGICYNGIYYPRIARANYSARKLDRLDYV